MVAPPEAVLGVSELTRQIQGLLGTTFGEVWVRGEISQPRRSGAGHVYLTLKDSDAVLPAVLWRSTAGRLGFDLVEGQEVLVRGGIDVYLPHGRYQLIVRSMEPVGEGALRLAFEQLRARLGEEGLFDEARKRPLPLLPRRIALVTSRTGAAVRDMVTVVRRRLPGVTLLLVPVRVQGTAAPAEIAHAIALADARADADVIITGRGGGSLEDLQAFNEEVVARAIAACSTPVVSAVGHETDVTIADLVADVRAATPSQAGELVVPDRADLDHRLDAHARRLGRHLRQVVDRAWQRLEAMAERPVLRTPRTLLRRRREQLAALGARLRGRSPVAALRRRAEAVAALEARLLPPLRRRLQGARERLEDAGRRATGAAQRSWTRGAQRVATLDVGLRALSPLAVLARGYSLTTDAEGRALRGAGDVAVGDAIRTRLADGASVASIVEAVEPPAAEEESR